jgi:hypothetical protein
MPTKLSDLTAIKARNERLKAHATARINTTIQRMFVDTADENYIVARWCYLNSLAVDFYWLGAHAVEKYVPLQDLLGRLFIDNFGLAKTREQTTYLAFYEPERSTFLDFCPLDGEHYPFMSLYLLAWRLPMALGLSSANTLSNLFHHEISKREKSKKFYKQVRDLVLEFEDAYDIDIPLEAFRAQYASVRKLEGVERDYMQLTTETSILFQQVAAESSRRSSELLTFLTWALIFLTVPLTFEVLQRGLCPYLQGAHLFAPFMTIVTWVCS